MKYLSLFSGIGGFELGIKQAYETIYNKSTGSEKQKTYTQRNMPDFKGGNSRQSSCIGFSEIDKYAIKIYQKHFPKHKNYGDITQIDAKSLPDFDLVVGGFPCQAFSVAGSRRGFDDTRGTLFFEIARIAKQKQPRLLLLENVKGLLSHDQGKTFRIIISTLDELGYDCQWQVLNSKYFGVPQKRERVFIIGHLRGTSRLEIFPIGQSSTGDIDSNIIGGTLTARYPASQREGAYIEEERHGEGKIRKLTPKECERLQGFPDGWTEGVSDTQRYKCLGNAVTVNVIEAIMSRLLTYIQ